MRQNYLYASYAPNEIILFATNLLPTHHILMCHHLKKWKMGIFSIKLSYTESFLVCWGSLKNQVDNFCHLEISTYFFNDSFFDQTYSFTVILFCKKAGNITWLGLIFFCHLHIPIQNLNVLRICSASFILPNGTEDVFS